MWFKSFFFDDLGGNWPIHDCNTSWGKNVIRSRDGSGGITVEISEENTVRRPPENFSIEEDIISKSRKSKSSRQQEPIIAVQPDDEVDTITVVGLLQEITLKADIGKVLNLPAISPMASAFLGTLGDKPLGKITIHEPSSSKNILHSYTIWVPSMVSCISIANIILYS